MFYFYDRLHYMLLPFFILSVFKQELTYPALYTLKDICELICDIYIYLYTVHSYSGTN